MFAAIYDYYLFTYGIKPLTDTLEKIQESTKLFSAACEAPSEHSPIIKILARGTTKPYLLYEFERLKYCLQMPVSFAQKIEKREIYKQTGELLDIFTMNLSTELIEGSNQIKAEWTAADTLEHLQRLVEEVIDLPTTFMYFTAINGAALSGFCVLIGIFFGSKSVKAPVDPVDDEVDDEVAEVVPFVPVVSVELRSDFQPGSRDSESLAAEKRLLTRDISDYTALAHQLQALGSLSPPEEKQPEQPEEGTGGRRRKRKTIRKQKSKTRKHKRHNKRRQTKAKKGRRRLTRKY